MLVDRTRSLCERGPFERSLAAYTARDDPRGNGKLRVNRHPKRKPRVSLYTLKAATIGSDVNCRAGVSPAGPTKWRPGKVAIHCLAPVFQSVRAGFFGAMDATINLATGFNAVTDYLAIAVGTGRCQHVNRAFETVKGPSFSGRDNLE